MQLLEQGPPAVLHFLSALGGRARRGPWLKLSCRKRGEPLWLWGFQGCHRQEGHLLLLIPCLHHFDVVLPCPDIPLGKRCFGARWQKPAKSCRLNAWCFAAPLADLRCSSSCLS